MTFEEQVHASLEAFFAEGFDCTEGHTGRLSCEFCRDLVARVLAPRVAAAIDAAIGRGRHSAESYALRALRGGP